jgi:hypothetical protein
VTKKKFAIIIWAVAGFLFLIVGLAVANAKDAPSGSAGSASSSVTSSTHETDVPLPVTAFPTPTQTISITPAPQPAPKAVGPASFVLPNFTDMDENEVESWFDARNISISTDFDYGDAAGSDCEDAGDGIVEDQTPRAGAKLKNSLSTDVYLSVYCDY